MKKSFETIVGEKQVCRELICVEANRHLKRVNTIFTLPSRDALCVKTFKKAYPNVVITAVEREKQIFEYLEQNASFPVFHNTIIGYANSISQKGKHHDIVFFDYYSFLSESVERDIVTFFKNDNVVHPGKPVIFAITLLKAHRSGSDKAKSLYQKHAFKGISDGKNTLKNEVDTIQSILLDLDPESVTFLDAKEYKADSHKSTSMYFILFKVEK